MTRTRALKNVTVTLEESLLRKARVLAAADDSSLSAFLAGILRERLTAESEYKQAMTAFLRQEPILSTDGGRLPGRDELHDRDLLR